MAVYLKWICRCVPVSSYVQHSALVRNARGKQVPGMIYTARGAQFCTCASKNDFFRQNVVHMTVTVAVLPVLCVYLTG